MGIRQMVKFSPLPGSKRLRSTSSRASGDTARRSLPGRGYASAFSPDGRWLAWGDLDGGISASPMPATGVTYRLAERGQTPLWMPNGDIVYRDGTRYIHLTLMRDGGLRPGRSELYAEGPFLSTWAWIHDALPDGRIVTLLRSPETTAAGLGVVTGFDRHVGRIAQR